MKMNPILSAHRDSCPSEFISLFISFFSLFSRPLFLSLFMRNLFDILHHDVRIRVKYEKRSNDVGMHGKMRQRQTDAEKMQEIKGLLH